MTDQDFLDRAMIALAPHRSSEYTCVVSAHLLLQERNKFRAEQEPPDYDVTDHIVEVDKLQARHYAELLERIESLEYTCANLVRVIEQNVPGWINTPQVI